VSDQKKFPLLAIGLSIILFIFHHLVLLPPTAKPATAPDDEFSAERAYAVLSTLLAEGVPHPVGSSQNKIVRQRIIDELNRLGIAYEEQNTWTCGLIFTACAYVENIIGIIPGHSEGNAIALMAHYDSVPMAPGAGDDGAGVAAILESARALVNEAPFEHPIFLVITDSEEMGLLGAAAFYHHHPRGQEIGVVLDFEGSGTTGTSLVLRTSEANELLINTLVEQTSSPYGFSFAAEIFKRMPNDTDFSVPLSLGIPGIDFAFAGERNHYHTPNDNLENIDLRTIQHHGENMLPLVRALADADLSDMGGRLVYGTLYHIWLQWLSDYSIYLVLLSAALLIFASTRLKPSIKGVSLGFVFSIGIIGSSSGLAFGAFQLIQTTLGTSFAWPAYDLPYRLVLLFSTLGGGLLLIAAANRRVSQLDQLFAAWLLWLLLSLLLVVYLPDAANVLLLPTLAAAFFIAAAGLVDERTRPWLFLLTLPVAIPSTLSLVYPLEQSQGYQLIMATYPFITLFLVIVAPLLKGLRLFRAAGVSIAVTGVLIVSINFIPLYSEHRPQIVNLGYFENLDSQTSYLQLQAGNPVEGELREAMNFSFEPKALVEFSQLAVRNWVEVGPSGLPGLEMNILDQQLVDTGRRVELELRSPRQADSLRLLVPIEAGLTDFELGGNRYQAVTYSGGLFAGYSVITVFGVYARSVPLVLNFASAAETDAILIDISTELPASGARLVQLRSGLLSPAHRGDQAFLIKRTSL
tara:strand:- start:9333 stop:11576 length:2244 start_codon:yes stop_codon:yes gene_type:complete